MTNKFKYYAFLSYCHQDAVVAETLHKKLESFRLPRGVTNECIASNRLQPIYKKESELVGELPISVRDALNDSKCLLLICSPEAAKSECVNREVSLFIAEGRVKHIVPYIVDGIPMCGGKRECFPPALVQYFKENPSHELLGIDTQKVNSNNAFYSVVSTLLDIPYNKLWDRLALVRRRILSIIAVSVAVTCVLLYYFAAPYSVTITLYDDCHPNLPYLRNLDGVIGMLYVSDKAAIPITKLDTVIVTPRIPGYLRGKTKELMFAAPYYDTTIVTVKHGYGLSSSFEMHLKRDSEFEVFSGRIWDLDTGNPIVDAWIEVDGGKFWAKSDSAGLFLLKFPLADQSEIKSISIKASGYEPYFDEEAVVDRNVSFCLVKSN